IRQLTVDCGYQEAALKERIYSTYPEEGSIDMAGILIYTSSSDSDGSLGGLVRQGECDLLEETMRNLLEEASWCSSDPLCIESKAQGFNSLNYAACHACTLLPETSCEANNCLLDRVAVVGKPDNRDIGYFGDLLQGEIDNG
ncbi:MAG: Zn-binding domain-containing protein, partial [Schwartzia succinivorans]|nr:Zn-binding domain-containing protein [Schwartzia succinivorans]